MTASTSAAAAAQPGASFERRIVEFVRGASTEITPHEEGLIPALAGRLPAGTVVYVAQPPRSTLEDIVRVSLRLETAGLRAAPHLVARRIGSERALREALAELTDGGVEQALVLAGDAERPAGKFQCSLEILETGLVQEAGIRRIGVAGHPEGHRAIGPGTLWKALRDKQALAEREGLTLHIVTQFGFDPAAIHAWERHFPEQGIALPIHVGMAGPAPLPQLIRYAMACGVGASLRGLVRNMNAMRNVAGLAAHPDEMLIGLIRGSSPPTRIQGMHLFSFGGVMASARWLRAVADGCFRMSADGEGFETY